MLLFPGSDFLLVFGIFLLDLLLGFSVFWGVYVVDEVGVFLARAQFRVGFTLSVIEGNTVLGGSIFVVFAVIRSSPAFS